MLKKILTSPWTALITLALVLSIRVVDPTFVESVRLRYFDTLITNKAPTENNVYTVNIDESALDKYGQWPFDRKIYADLIEDLYQRKAGLVVLNVLMTEPDRQGGDGALAATLNEFPVVFPNIPSDRNKNKPRQPSTAVIGAEHAEMIVTYPGLIANVREIEKRAVGTGIVNTLPEVDGVVRRMPLVVAVDGIVYPSLAMEALSISGGDSTTQIKLFEGGVEKMRIPAFGPITTDALGQVWIDWSQRSRSVSMTDLPKDFSGAVVIVGVAAAGLGNPVPTAMGSVWPQDVQAAVLGTMFNNITIQRPDYADGLEILSIAIVGILLLFLTRYVYVGLVSTIVLVAGGIVGSWFAFNNYLFLFDATAFALGTILVALHAYGAKFVNEFLQKQQIKKQFGSYVSPVIVERLQKNPELIKLGGEEKMLTAVMTDMRNFTGLGEKYGTDVEGFTAIMNAYMTAIAKPVFDNNGCLIKFIGDASLHIHGAPLDDERHAYHAVKTAIEMVKAVEEFNKHLESIGKPPVGMGAGVNTGKILVGNIGAEGKMGYDVLGDPVSVASRLEGQTKPYGVLLIIGPDTYTEVKDDFYCFELDCIAVKGKAIGLNIYTPLFNPDNYNEQDSDRHREMLTAYRDQDFVKAERITKSLVGCHGGELDHYYELWLERIKEMKNAKLPKDWDGIYRATSK